MNWTSSITLLTTYCFPFTIQLFTGYANTIQQQLTLHSFTCISTQASNGSAMAW